MFYNTYRATKSAMRKRGLSESHINSFINPKERLLNQPKRQKLKNLLITKFMQKYNIKNPNDFLEPVISQFLLSKKLNDMDLKRLDIQIQKLLKDKTAQDNLKSTLTQNLQQLDCPNNFQSTEPNEIKSEKKEPVSPTPKLSNTIDYQEKNIKKDKDFPTINPLNTYSNSFSKNDKSFRNRGFSSYSIRGKKMNYFKTPAEELAELEKELAEEEEKTKNIYQFQRIEIPRGGDEWGTIVKYNKKMFDLQLLEEKIKDKNDKKRTKDYLDYQVKQKIKKEYEDELKEKEFNKIMEEHTKKLDEIEKEKAQKIKEQIIRLKENRDEQLKNEITRKKIEELKNKKFEMMLVKNYKQNMEKEKNQKLEKKKRENEALRKAI